MKITYIEFDDPMSLDTWRSQEEVEEEFKDHPLNEAVGWVLKETPEHIVLSSHKNADMHCSVLRVPKAIITTRKDL